MESPKNMLYKFIVVGEGQTGKTSILLRVTSNKFHTNTKQTVKANKALSNPSSLE
jgi:GTPase SAR1 family protein